jgi:hypothetical protein
MAASASPIMWRRSRQGRASRAFPEYVSDHPFGAVRTRQFGTPFAVHALPMLQQSGGGSIRRDRGFPSWAGRSPHNLSGWVVLPQALIRDLAQKAALRPREIGNLDN